MRVRSRFCRSDDHAGTAGLYFPARPSVEEAHPSLSLLDTPDPNGRKTDEESIQLTSRLIVAKLKSYNIDAEVLGAQPGPVITQYRLEPGPGVKGAQIESVRDDLRRALGVQAVRIVLSIPGTSCIGIEVPNPVRETVRLKEILKSEAYEKRTPQRLRLPWAKTLPVTPW